MANSPQAKKRIRTSAARTRINAARRSRVRTFLKKVDAAVAAGNKDEATAAFKTAESELMRSVTKGVFKKNTAARTVSRMNARIKALSA